MNHSYCNLFLAEQKKHENSGKTNTISDQKTSRFTAKTACYQTVFAHNSNFSCSKKINLPVIGIKNKTEQKTDRIAVQL